MAQVIYPCAGTTGHLVNPQPIRTAMAKSCGWQICRDRRGITAGTVIANVDTALLNAMSEKRYRSHRHSRRAPAQAAHYGGGRSR